MSATEDSPYLQIGEVKYGRPILDRGIEFGSTSLEVAGTYALLSLDAAMRSNVTVGPPLEVLLYQNDKLEFDRYRRFEADDPELDLMHACWEQTLRRAVEELPTLHFAALKVNASVNRESPCLHTPATSAEVALSPSDFLSKCVGVDELQRGFSANESRT